MIVTRDHEISAFIPTPYVEVEATFEGPGGAYKGTYYVPPASGLRDDKGRLKPFQPLLARLNADGVNAQAIVARARAGRASVMAIAREPRRSPPPQLYDLTELQRDANRLYGYSAQQTLDVAQALYEKHKVLSYPRTDSRHLSTDIAATLPSIVHAIAAAYPNCIAPNTGVAALGSRYVDDAKVGDHHALLPTASIARLVSGSPESNVYDLVCRRLLMAWHAELVESVTRVITEVRSEAAGKNAESDLFASAGSSVESPGWTVLKSQAERRPQPSAAPKIPGGLVEGDVQRVSNVLILTKKTQPPKPYTEGALLTAMETAGRKLDDKALIDALRESGLGTPATRAATIETLLARKYIVRTGKALAATPLGEALIASVDARVKSAELTGSWELRLRRMERGEEAFEPFMTEIAQYVRVVTEVEARKAAAARRAGASAGAVGKGVRSSGRAVGRRPRGRARRAKTSTATRGKLV
jgi:DNA topoisomerase-3